MPATLEEIASVIRFLKDKKGIKLEDLDTKFLKFSTNLIAPILRNIFNICAKTGEFLGCLIIAEVILFIFKRDALKATNYRPIFVSQFDKF